MSRPIIFIFAALIVTVAYLIARNARHQGYHFWRTWVMSVIGLTSVVLLFLKLIS
jgi:hypothetical protein